MADVEIVLHPIPTPQSKPYIIVVGPDQHLWFCENGTSKIGRMNPGNGSFIEFDTPTRNSRPIGIAPAADGTLWFCENAGNRVGRISTSGAVTEFPVPTADAGPDGIVAGPDGNIWFSEGNVSRIGRITPDGAVTEFSKGLTPGCRGDPPDPVASVLAEPEVLVRTEYDDVWLALRRRNWMQNDLNVSHQPATATRWRDQMEMPNSRAALAPRIASCSFLPILLARRTYSTGRFSANG